MEIYFRTRQVIHNGGLEFHGLYIGIGSADFDGVFFAAFSLEVEINIYFAGELFEGAGEGVVGGYEVIYKVECKHRRYKKHFLILLLLKGFQIQTR